MSVQNPPLARIAVRSGVWFSLGTYLTQIIGFVATLAMTRILSPEIFGFFSLGLFWSALLNLRPKAGLNYAAVRQPQTDGALLGTYLVLDSLAAVGSILLSIVVTAVLAQLGYPPEVTTAALVLLGADTLTTLVSPLAMVLEKELQLSRLTLVGLIASLVAYAVAIILALSGYGILSLLAINIIINALSLGGVIWVCQRRWPQAFRLR
jgi:PST family polysaccharide transporter